MSTVIVVGMVAFLAWLLFMLVRPENLPSVAEPIPVLNPDRVVAVGEPIVLELSVVKDSDTDVVSSSRSLLCDSGNLITLTSVPRDLPTGRYTLVSDSAVLPDKIVDGDTCVLLFHVDYRLNPVRIVGKEWTSVPFTVVQGG